MVEAISRTSTNRVRVPVMLHGWKILTFLHWRYEPAVVQALLPSGLEVDTHDGSAWVGLTPFRITVTVPGVPPVPGLSTFPETNCRTYCVGPDGRRAVWFFSLDVSRLAVVAAARATYGVPYQWAQMQVYDEGSRIRYASRRKGDREVRNRLEVEVGEPIAERDVSELDNFLTARWGLYSTTPVGLIYAPVEHQPWPLTEARVVTLDQTIVSAAGLPAPAGDPLVHFSPGVDARIGAPKRVGR
ncbi:MAG: YqjF family protein [Mycobacteriales bacterium]|nr:DUF2071 domain-containing protein [Frankia sp.]